MWLREKEKEGKRERMPLEKSKQSEKCMNTNWPKFVFFRDGLFFFIFFNITLFSGYISEVKQVQSTNAYIIQLAKRRV